MKVVLISIQPKWCELIANGKKTVEVRKTKPKLETPFKVYIYETKALYKHFGCNHLFEGNGKVIGEFVCDRVSPIAMPYYEMVDAVDCKMSCLSAKEILNYAKNKPLYGWHISDLVIYDTPKELREFTKPYGTIIKAFDSRFITRQPQSWCYVERLGD